MSVFFFLLQRFRGATEVRPGCSEGATVAKGRSLSMRHNNEIRRPKTRRPTIWLEWYMTFPEFLEKKPSFERLWKWQRMSYVLQLDVLVQLVLFFSLHILYTFFTRSLHVHPCMIFRGKWRRQSFVSWVVLILQEVNVKSSHSCRPVVALFSHPVTRFHGRH